MARPQAQAKMGFFPVEPENLALIGRHIAPAVDRNHRTYVLDPCCGEGRALKQWGEMLGIPDENLYGVELSNDRALKTKALLPDAHVVGPNSYFNTKVTGSSFSIAYLNPPFDDELGGGCREEMRFVTKAHYQLVVGGLLVLVCPITAIYGKNYFVETIDTHFEDVRVFKFPPERRKFKEIVLFGRKRKDVLPGMVVRQEGSWLYSNGWYYGSTYYHETADAQLEVVGGTELPIHHADDDYPIKVDQWSFSPGMRPHTFVKGGYTEEELGVKLQASPLNTFLTTFTPPPPKRPPLPPGKGHVALLLFGDILQDIVVYPDAADKNFPDKQDEEPHVVRGTSSKIERPGEPEVTENPETGAVSEKVVISQIPILTIRAVGPDGVIYTFGGTDEAEARFEASGGGNAHTHANGTRTETVTEDAEDAAIANILRKIAGLVAKLRSDSGCPQGERDSAEHLIRHAIEKHGLTKDQAHRHGITTIDRLFEEVAA